jgi:hypothetical protein
MDDMDEDATALYHFDPRYTGSRHPGDAEVLAWLEGRMRDASGPIAEAVEEAARFGRLESPRAHGLLAMLRARFGKDRARTRAACIHAIRRDMRPTLELLRGMDVDPRRHPSATRHVETIASVCIMRLAYARRLAGDDDGTVGALLDDWWRDGCALLVELLEGEAMTSLMRNDDIRRDPTRTMAALTSILEEMTSPTLRTHTQMTADRIQEAIGLATKGNP